ncbi:MAG: hypothetical protein NC127_08915 [Muribaculum sp.]|nr:hypothetical protein [Muribaculum sp.]
MSTLYLLSYNNYYNRLVKMESNLSGYQRYLVQYNGRATDPNGNTAVIQGINFVVGNYVDTTQVINWQGDIPDYLLVVEDNIIQTRWFVVGAEKSREGQLVLTLHRDLVVDYYDNLMDPETAIFVEKAMISGANDLIFNSEDMSFNQIKTSETMIKDASGCPWVCIYAASKDAQGVYTSFDVTTGTSIPISQVFESEAEFNAWVPKKCFDTGKGLAGQNASLIYLHMIGQLDNTNTDFFRGYGFHSTGDAYITIVYDALAEFRGYVRDIDMTIEEASQIVFTQWAAISRALTFYYDKAGPEYIFPKVKYSQVVTYDPTAYSTINERLSQFIQVETTRGTKYYKVTATVYELPYGNYNPVIATSSGEIDVALTPLTNPVTGIVTPGTSQTKRYVTLRFNPGKLKNINIEEITSSVHSASMVISPTRYHLTDAPYDLFCMPLSDTLKITNSLVSDFEAVTANKQLAISVARELLSKYSGAGTIYDAQILPYCPLTSTIVSQSNGEITLDLYDADKLSYSPIPNENNEVVGYLMHASVSSFSRRIELDNPIVITDYKIQNECDMYRLCSPNYDGVFEFSAAKNGGVSAINIQCTYKPYNPYVKLFPDWGRLYGESFSPDGFDARGLVCGGDFSLPVTSSAWETYELQNKNYQAIFNRQIQNLEITQSVQKIQEIWNIAAGTIGASAQGASAGASVGGPIGAAAGAITSGASSLIGGLLDRSLNNILRYEAIDYTRDQFGYQLGNIKALPESLSKVSAYNIDNKYFPFIEYYTCSAVERTALKNKIKYNGMTIMTIGTLQEYVAGYSGTDPMYFKGKLIRLQGFKADYHILNALSGELYKGVFIV